jgi:hypothetical protein
MAQLSAITAPRAGGEELSLTRIGAAASARESSLRARTRVARESGDTTAGKADARKVLVKQVMLVRRSTIVPAAPATRIAVTSMHNVPVVVVVSAAGVDVFDLSTDDAPLRIQSVLARGVRGATVWRDRLLVWGDRGVASLPARESEVWSRSARSAPVADAVRVGDHLALLDDSGVHLLSHDLSTVGHVGDRGASGLAAAGRRLLVQRQGELEVFDLARPLSPRREAVHAFAGHAPLAAPGAGHARSALYVRRESGGGSVLELAGAELVEAARYESDPWFHGAGRVGRTIARLEEHGARIAVWRIAITKDV